MKKLTLLLVLCVMVLSVFTPGLGFAAENFSLNLDEGELICGSRNLVFWSSADGELELKLDGKEINGETVSGLTLAFTASEIDFANNGFFYDGKLLCNINKETGAQKARVDIDAPGSGFVDITLLPSVGEGVLDTTKKYGEYNIDDLSVADVHILLPNGNKIIPAALIKALPIVGESGVIESESDYKGEAQRIGDGWNSTTGLGGSTPNVPVYLTFRFDAAAIKAAAGVSKMFEFDSTSLADGTHSIDLFRDGVKLKTVKFSVDNTPPSFVSNIKFGQVLNSDFVPSVIAVDENAPVDIKINIDGEPFEGPSLRGFDYGRHTITVTAADLCGNTSAEVFQITIVPDEPLISKNALELSMGGRIKLPYAKAGAPDRLELYTYAPVQKIRTYTLDGDKQKDYTFGTLTETKAADSPVHYFDLTVSEKSGAFKFEYQGTASENTNIAIYAKKSVSDDWVLVGKSPSGAKSVITIEEPQPYLEDSIIHLKATPDYVISDSNTLLWVTDTQYYTRFEDLYPTYESIMNYAVDMYNGGKIGYVVHTGDVVDEIGEAAFAARQYEAGSRMQKIIDDAGIPNGIVSGNHDVVMATADHSLFNKYFGAERYAAKPWYGGNLESNTSHYDLITIGGYDFVFLYLGWGVEARPETIVWANKVLKQYQSRNAIICVHGYLGVNGEMQLDPGAPLNYTHTRAKEIWENIIVPNENVLAVLCGHTPGVARTKRQVGESDRYVWEILADYQFVETGDDPQHILNGINCDGEGYIRLVSFDGKMMSHQTYSPLHDDYNFFADDKEEFTVDLVLSESKHTLKTDAVAAISAFEQLELVTESEGNAVVFTVDRDKTHGKIMLIAEDAQGFKYETNLKILDSSDPDLKIVLFAVGVVVTLTALVLTVAINRNKKRGKGKTTRK